MGLDVEPPLLLALICRVGPKRMHTLYVSRPKEGAALIVQAASHAR
jgi:hypothetical protein